MNRSLSTILAAGLLLALAGPSRLRAEYDAEMQPLPKYDDSGVMERKHPGFFHRPKQATPEAQWQYANDLLAKGKEKKAMKSYAALVYQWHDSPLAPKAQLAFADLLYKRRCYADAFDEYQYLVERYVGQFPFDEVLDKQVRIANQVMTQKHLTLGLFAGFSSPERAVPLFEKIARNAPNGDAAPEALFHLGLIHEQNGAYVEAVSAYDSVRQKHPGHPRANEAAFRKARCLFLIAEESPRDESLCRQALAALAGFLGDCPTSPSVPEATGYRDRLRQRLASLYHDRAVFYDQMGTKPRAALIAYDDFLRKFPSSTMAEDVGKRMEAIKKEMEKPK